MKAITLKAYGNVDNFELTDIPIPPVTKTTVRIKIKAVSFNPVDFQIMKGLPESSMVTSNILGRDLSGIIDEVAEDVTVFKKGDEVYCYVCNLASSGTYTEYITVPAEMVAKKPVSLTHTEAASVPVAGITAMMALAKTNPGSSKSIFIAGGAGGVGTFVIKFAKQYGYKNLFTTAGNDKSLSYLINDLHLKKEQVLNYKEDDFIQEAVKKNKGYFNITIDLVGGKMLTACCELLAIDGNFASITDAPGKEDFEILFQKNGSFHSVGANAYSLTDDRQYWKKYQDILNHIAQLFDTNIVSKPLIKVLGPLSTDTVKKAYELFSNNSIQGKLIMEVDV